MHWYLLECSHYGCTQSYPEPVANDVGQMLGCLTCSDIGADEGKTATVKRRVVHEVKEPTPA
jgi:hypothetical protein